MKGSLRKRRKKKRAKNSRKANRKDEGQGVQQQHTIGTNNVQHDNTGLCKSAVGLKFGL